MSGGTLAALLAAAMAAAAAVAFAYGRIVRRRRSLSAQEQSVQAQAAAVAAERERIYRDLHDDLGAKLLTLVHGAADPALADLARSALQDLRDVVSRTRGEPGTLQMALGEIRREAEQRLAAAGARLAWEPADDLPDPALDAAQALHLYRIVREALSNALKHAQARTVRIRVRRHGGALYLDVTDDGPGVAEPPGQGVHGMRRRAEALGGAVDWSSGTVGGTKVTLHFPLPDG
ncbi:sensor histidine kinase [Solimonas variicoloris]|uniref:sensor histidine kinase n=1 Tax=Solimonas variicoloris TaxID=254408 RepID=UPI00035FBE14|nr:ATP-binding protein [Solimonas variicoloris]